MNAEKSATVTVRTETDSVMLVDADFLKYLVTKDIYDWIQKHKTDPIETYGPNYLEHFTFTRVDNDIMAKVSAKAYLFLFSGSSKNTFRYGVGFEKEYKGNRKPNDNYAYETGGGSRTHYDDMAEVMHVVKTRYTTFVHKDLEADDLVSVLHREGACVFSHDKDLMQLPGKHFKIREGRVIDVSAADALMFHCYQLLAGDSGDNIPGFPGMGEKKSKDFLNKVGDVKQMPFAIIKHYMVSFGINEGIDRFVESWNLTKLRMDRGTYFKEKLAKEIETVNSLIESK